MDEFNYSPDFKYGSVGSPTMRDFRDWEWEHILSHQIKNIQAVLHLDLSKKQAIIVVNLR